AMPLAPTTIAIQEQHSRFREQLATVRTSVERLIKQGAPAVGFGAAQMVPTLAYYMQTDFGFLDAIIDDNEMKSGLSYPSIATTIRPAAEFADLSSHAVLVTACDSARAILPRLISARARYILNPCNPF